MRTLWTGLLVALLCASAWAQTEVAIVNVDEVIARALPVREVIDAADAEIAEKQMALRERSDELSAMVSNYRDQADLWSEEVVAEQQRQIIELRLDLEEMESDLQRFIAQIERERIVPALATITAVIRDIASEREIDLVLRSDAAVFAAEDLDLTAEVIERLNEQPSESGEGSE